MGVWKVMGAEGTKPEPSLCNLPHNLIPTTIFFPLIPFYLKNNKSAIFDNKTREKDVENAIYIYYD